LNNPTTLTTATALAAWLQAQFAEWQSAQPGRTSLSAFADYLGLDRTYLHKFAHGQHRPSRLNAIKIAARLGPEIYDLLGQARP